VLTIAGGGDINMAGHTAPLALWTRRNLL
jgi:hypothetical protein